MGGLSVSPSSLHRAHSSQREEQGGGEGGGPLGSPASMGSEDPGTYISVASKDLQEKTASCTSEVRIGTVRWGAVNTTIAPMCEA